MPSIQDLKESKFLSKTDLQKPVLVTIRGYDHVNVEVEGSAPKMRYVLHFNEVAKPLVLNSTNGQIIAQITGDEDFDGWIGKKIVLYFDPNISFAGRLTGGIRVRAARTTPSGTAPVNTPKAPAPAVLPPAVEPDPEAESDDLPF